MTLALGLMSGTSGDGVSAAIADFKDHSFKLIAYQTFPYPKLIRKKISLALQLKTSEISQLNMELGELFTGAALKIIKRSKISPKKIAVIGSHGQTIYHGPTDRARSTLQIGEAAVIAARTGISVVSDFRPMDVALGGEGAPLMPYFDFFFYGNGPVRALQNIGGIANVTIVGRRIHPIAFDTGPGNCLIDLAMQKITKGKLSHDPQGNWSAAGLIDTSLIWRLMRHPYFKRRPPKSTGREEFGEGFLKKHFGDLLVKRPKDALATLTFFTALTIHNAVAHFSPQAPQEIIVSGGGAFNLTLMRHLKELFGPTKVWTMEEFGIPNQAKEPIAFAFFGLRALQGKPNHLPQTTGARKSAILGKITLVPLPKVPGSI